MRLRQIAPIALILVGAVACTSSGSGGNTPAPTSALPTTSAPSTTAPTAPSSSSTPTPTVATTGPNVRPGEKPPMLTVGSRMHSPGGALQFSVVWLRALDWGYATTDSTFLRSLSSERCSECERFASIFDKVSAAGGHFRGGRLAYSSSTLISDDNRHPGTTPVDLIFDQQAVQQLNANGESVKSEIAYRGTRFRLWESWSGSSWTAVDFEQVVRK